MKKHYTIIFSLNSLNEYENYITDLSEIEEKEKLIKKSLDKIIFKPRQKIVDEILKFARESKS